MPAATWEKDMDWRKVEKPEFSGPGGNGKKNGEKKRGKGRIVRCVSSFLLSRLLSGDDKGHQINGGNIRTYSC